MTTSKRRPTTAEASFRLALIASRNPKEPYCFQLFSRNTLDEASYFHGWFSPDDQDEMLESLKDRCESLGIRPVVPYLKTLLMWHSF
jgi:hypothetical protein